MKPSFDIAEALKLLEVMKQTIPGLLTIQFGTRRSDLFEGHETLHHGVTHALVSTHKDIESLKIYAEHPDHVALVELLVPQFSAEPTVVDFFSEMSS
eukprot:CAMPEP_0176440814 /NCGR_PEP_ID=MMETSP0127-20121128/20803_1 /TAXON_ID=938130 /ORGANISM="Platyophrya macrostoma, Strain WH" /LENGTH=96 /DNA_ID=CAMNT_0017825427 /DNA_START=87 /DNA_END=377 /DNA_ORIENTATION=+